VTWSPTCSYCGGMLGGCKCAPDDAGDDAPVDVRPGADDSTIAAYQRRVQQFAERVEQAVETGDQSDVDRRIGRFIRSERFTIPRGDDGA
jgi:hypothetical protein